MGETSFTPPQMGETEKQTIQPLVATDTPQESATKSAEFIAAEAAKRMTSTESPSGFAAPQMGQSPEQTTPAMQTPEQAAQDSAHFLASEQAKKIKDNSEV